MFILTILFHSKSVPATVTVLFLPAFPVVQFLSTNRIPLGHKLQRTRTLTFFRDGENPAAFVMCRFKHFLISKIYLFLKQSCKHTGAATSGVASLKYKVIFVHGRA